MSIKSGQRYKITNKLTRLVIDLSGGDNKSIIGFKFHGGENQLVTAFTIFITCASYNHGTLQWITEEQDDGLWTIQSVSAQTYIGFENDLEDGTHLVALDKPQLWDIETLKCDHPNKINIKYVLCFITNFTGERF